MLYFSGFNYNIKYQEFSTLERCMASKQFILDAAAAREYKKPATVCVPK